MKLGEFICNGLELVARGLEKLGYGKFAYDVRCGPPPMATGSPAAEEPPRPAVVVQLTTPEAKVS